MKLLIPGGAGYIGSHMVRLAQKEGHEVTVLDDFSTGHEWAIKNCEILKIDLLDHERLDKSLKNRYFDGVIHFAAKSLVGESVIKPAFYYRNNVVGSLNLFNSMLKNDINNIVFSSTAAIFGNPISEKISEDHPKEPINPYGQSKLMIEKILKDMAEAYGINATCMRYFNASGAHKSAEIGEAHNPETHLIPNILISAISNTQKLKVFGDDYNTHDGTCIRDYVHVDDLADAHLLGLKHMIKNKGFFAFNLGNGNGFSVMDVIRSCERVTKKNLDFNVCKRREGDPAKLVADSTYAKECIGWDPHFNKIDDIVTSAWRWHKNTHI